MYHASGPGPAGAIPFMPERRLLQSLALCACLLAGAPAHAAGDVPNGVFLVASPALRDPNFEGSVVLATQRADGGTLGVIVNRPTPVALRDLFPGSDALRDSSEPVFSGGPVSRNTLVFVVRAQSSPGKALQVLGDLWLGSDPDLLLTLLGRAAQTPLRVYSGYAGWAPGQLAAEVERGAWYLVPADADSVFAPDPQALWQRLLQRAAGRPVRLDPSPASPPDRAWAATPRR